MEITNRQLYSIPLLSIVQPRSCEILYTETHTEKTQMSENHVHEVNLSEMAKVIDRRTKTRYESIDFVESIIVCPKDFKGRGNQLKPPFESEVFKLDE